MLSFMPLLQVFDRPVSTLREKALNALFPPQCAACSQMTERHGALCQECWSKLVFLADPCCQRCGFPFEFDTGAGILCPACLNESPAFAMARSVLRYDELSRAIIIPFKYHDQTDLIPACAAWLARAGQPFLHGCEALVPVPISYKRLVRRTYNQAGLLAGALGKQCGLPVLHEALTRIKKQIPQEGLTRKEREKNVQGAFAVQPKHANQVRGKTLVLVDDVMTTGATLNECTRALLEAGARDVYVLTLARTLKEF